MAVIGTLLFGISRRLPTISAILAIVLFVFAPSAHASVAPAQSTVCTVQWNIISVHELSFAVPFKDTNCSVMLARTGSRDETVEVFLSQELGAENLRNTDRTLTIFSKSKKLTIAVENGEILITQNGTHVPNDLFELGTVNGLELLFTSPSMAIRYNGDSGVLQLSFARSHGGLCAVKKLSGTVNTKHLLGRLRHLHLESIAQQASCFVNKASDEPIRTNLTMSARDREEMEALVDDMSATREQLTHARENCWFMTKLMRNCLRGQIMEQQIAANRGTEVFDKCVHPPLENFQALNCRTHECLSYYYKCEIDKNEFGVCVLSDGIRINLQAERREIRELTAHEVDAYFKAVQKLKDEGYFDGFQVIHACAATAYNGVHRGPAFPGWHREFLKRFEIAVRMMNPKIKGIPYWDSTLDHPLPHPANSTLWTGRLLGNGFGDVVTGPCAHWKTDEGQSLNRSTGTSGEVFSKEAVDRITNSTDITATLACTNALLGCPSFNNQFKALEIIHNFKHDFVGGKMANVTTAANDLAFYAHHANVDRVYEKHRQNWNRTEREYMYPDMGEREVCAKNEHRLYSRMKPEYWNLINKDGLSNVYTDLLYKYAPSPTCNKAEDCGSDHLFCDRRTEGHRCVAKVVPNGSCTGFEIHQVCDGGVCVKGLCELLAM
ncbi:hypothetical protein L596_010824 [Steinernema carpocapsae]|uniref:Tyrosinase copper-binding domain-containing protein n=1 Tax=Steinernema carpocapsae TaxID=34508 RepID=A0A4U5PJS8_STECR|nr:hypothetical protein L596_010824 [Steinernema carpocapsae]